MFEKIVVAVDGSLSASQAFDVALAMAENNHAELGICSVVDPIVVTWTAPASPGLELLLREAESWARQLIRAAVERALRKGVAASGATRLGGAASQILKYAEEFGANAIVMGTHGRGGLRRLFMGSVAESVLRDSSVPVIVVRERERKQVPVPL